MKKHLMLLLLAVALPFSLAAAENWVNLNANFPDEVFRTVIKNAAGSANYNKSTGEVNVNAITSINLGTKTAYDVKSTKGIELCKNLQTLTLKAPAKNVTIKLQEIDVSGLPYLTKIDNQCKSKRGAYTLTGSYSVSIKDEASFISSFKMPNNIRIIARNCPRLKFVNLSQYTGLVEFDCTGSDAIEELYLMHAGIKKLDISHLKNLTNKDMSGYWGDDEFYGSTMNMKGYRHFSLNDCKELTELIVGDIPLHYLDISGCDKLESLDLSRMPNLKRLHGVMSSVGTLAPEYSTSNKFSDNGHTHANRSGGAFKNVILPEAPGLGELTLTHGLIADIDLSVAGQTLKYVDLSYNKFSSFPMSSLTCATRIDVGSNRIRHLDMPPKTCTYLGITDNAMTQYGQLYNGGYTNITCNSMYQYVRIGDVFRFKILDNPDDAKYIELEDDNANQQYFWGINGNDLGGRIHIGNPEADEKDYDGNPTGRKEDPCYVYFENDFCDAVYFYRNQTTENTHDVDGWMKVYLCRGADEDIVPRIDYYLAGDFNNWHPSECDKFVYDADTQLYYLDYPEDQVIERHFRVWGIDPSGYGADITRSLYDDVMEVNTATPPAAGKTYFTIKDICLDYGGNNNEKSAYDGYATHIKCEFDIHHAMDTDRSIHFTTWLPEVSEERTGSAQAAPMSRADRRALTDVSIEMRVDALNSPDNYLTISGSGITNGLHDLNTDASADAPVVYYDLSGHRTDATVPGIYIRRHGASATKVIVK